jgi:hypothetical protein
MPDMYCVFCDLPVDALRQRMLEALRDDETVSMCSRCKPRLESVLDSIALPLVHAALVDPKIQAAIRSAMRAKFLQIVTATRSSD